MGIFSFIIGVGILIVVLKILLLPAKLIFKFVFNSILGGIILIVCGVLGMVIALNWWTILLVGLLGVPGFFIAILITIII